MDNPLPHTTLLSQPNSSSGSSMYRSAVEGPLTRGNSFASTDLESSKSRRRSPIPQIHVPVNKELPQRHSSTSAVARTLSVKEAAENGGDGGELTARETSTVRKFVSTWSGLNQGMPTKEDMEKYEKAFKLFDHDGEGFITCGELGRVMRSLGMDANVDELHYMISAADLNRSGTVEFEEFVQMMNDYHANHHQEEDEDELILKVFQVFDRTNDGYISTLELKSVMKQLGENITEEELNGMLKCADTNGDGTITFEEFRRICTSGDIVKKLRN